MLQGLPPGYSQGHSQGFGDSYGQQGQYGQGQSAWQPQQQHEGHHFEGQGQMHWQPNHSEGHWAQQGFGERGGQEYGQQAAWKQQQVRCTNWPVLEAPAFRVAAVATVSSKSELDPGLVSHQYMSILPKFLR